MYMCVYLHTNETVKLLMEVDDVGETCDAFNKLQQLLDFRSATVKFMFHCVGP